MFDLEKDLETQGFALHSFDVIVGANVVHAARDLDGALKRMSLLLAPGGILLLVEATHHHGWFDFTTGLIEGWQHFADELARRPSASHAGAVEEGAFGARICRGDCVS